MKPSTPFLLSAAVLLSTAAVAQAAPVAPPAFTVKVFAGAPSHATSGPDDITSLNGNVFVAWQNGIGPKGEAGPQKVLDSTVVQYSHSGSVINKWSLPGKVDGISGDGNRLIATANEDGNSILYVVNPGAPKKFQVTQYAYMPAPDSSGSSAVHTGGGTDSVQIVNGQILVAASAPTHSGRGATFRVTLATTTTRKKTKVGGKIKSVKVVTHVATLSSTFLDNSHATDAVTGNPITLHLTDPDSNALVPASLSAIGGPFAGDYVLSGQSNDQLVFAAGLGSGHTTLTRLPLTYVDPITQAASKAGIDDVRWAPADNSTLYAVDNKANKIYKVKGPFTAGEAIAAMDTVGTKSLGGTLATLNDGSGELDPFLIGLKAAKGLLFMP
ncbi:MAG: hypothetical protein M3022_05820 [Actinomycetota bacterium]|nr:hypothetical protein [Actinomycetota bacterium]